MSFLELYYGHYKENCNKDYGTEPISLPYAVRIPDKQKRREFEDMFQRDGFECVVGENGYPCMYVNFTLKRYGRSVKPCSSGAVNPEPMTLEAFMRDVYEEYHRDAEFGKKPENNYLQSARICLDRSIDCLANNRDKRTVNKEYLEYEQAQTEKYRSYIIANEADDIL